jgi:vacuolar protein sorting-associated protein 45
MLVSDCRVQESALFDFRRGDGALLLLIVDRLDDPVTPLLSQWTYQVSRWGIGETLAEILAACSRLRTARQAMVHELLDIDNNRVDLRSLGSKVAKENQELVLSADQDAFFHAQMFNNYGTLHMPACRAAARHVSCL